MDTLGPILAPTEMLPPGATPEDQPAPAPIVIPPGATDIRLLSPDGRPGKFSIQDLPTLIQAGFQQMPPEMAHQLDLQEKHSSAVESLKAAGQGAAEMLAPVVAPALMNLAGRTYEEQRESAEMHPFAHGAGQVAGAVAPAIATLGAGALPAAGKGALQAAAKASAPEVIGALGAKAAAPVAGKGALARITASAVNQATQGAAYAGADWANKLVQEDPRATAEMLFSQGVGGMLFGGALGALGGAMTRAAGAHTGDFLEMLKDMEARGGIKATGAIQGLIGKWEKQVGPERVKRIGTFLGREGGVGPWKSFEEMLEHAETRFKEPAVKEMERILTSVTGEKKGYGFIDEVIDEIRHDPAIKRWRDNPLQKDSYAAFESKLGDLERKWAHFDADGNITYYKAIHPDNLHELSKQFAAEARGYGSSLADPHRSQFAEAFDKARYITNRRLDQVLDDVSKQWGMKGGKLIKEWEAAKFRYQAGLFLEEGATLGWKRSIGNNQISPMETIGAMTGAVTGHAPGAALLGTAVAVARREGSAIENWGARHVGDFIEKLQSRSGQKLSDGIERIFRGVGGRISAEAAEVRSEHRVTRENFPEKMSMLSRMSQDPEHTAEKITESLGPLVEGNGQVALALHDTTAKTAQALVEALPVPQKVGPLDPDYTPSPSELARFNRQWLVAHEPASVLHRIADGTYLPEDGATLQRMYPALSQRIKADVADALADKLASREPIPRATRIALSSFLGIELDRNTTGGAIAQAQSIYLAQAQKPQQAPAPKKVDFDSAKSYSTDRQASQARMGEA